MLPYVAYAERDYLELTPGDARRQWESIRQRRSVPAGSRQVNFVPVETLLCLAAMYVVEHSRFGSGSAHRAPEPVQQLARLFKRPPSSVLAKMANLDGSRSHGAKHDLLAGTRLRSAPELMTETYRTVLAAARAAGIGAETLPDFLHLEHGGRLELLGQEELDTSAVEAALERELAAWTGRLAALTEKETERLLMATVRVGQHRFARGVLANCADSCVFCGFALDNGGPRLLRASHVKPWSESSHRERLDVANGLAACPTHDAAFDIGLVTIDADLRVRRSARLEASMAHNAAVRRAFEPGGLRDVLALPDTALTPAHTYVEWHQKRVFVG